MDNGVKSSMKTVPKSGHSDKPQIWNEKIVYANPIFNR